MNILDIIAKKRDGKILTKQEINFFIEGYTNGQITDYQAAALVMAIYINSMTMEEITNLTIAMANSGEILDLSDLGTVVDKHSTGGVGDKITLILMPIIASLGVPVAKMSGRGLGFTGGTAYKLESIPNYNTNLSIQEFKQNVKEIGISLITQTGNLAPADKKLYALRDTISCTNSIPLIASSIMSKKIAAGASKILIDVTCGNGAFMKNVEEAEKLSNIMKQIGKLVGKETVCIITNMDEPLGYAVGNAVEVIETINSLKGDMSQDVKEVVLELGSYMLKLAGKGNDLEENKKKIEYSINSGIAYKKFIELVKKQGGNSSYIKDIGKFRKAKYEIKIYAKQDGYISKINAEEIGKLTSFLGTGRIKKDDKIDMKAGIIFNKKVSYKVQKNEQIATIYSNDKEKLKQAEIMCNNAIFISEKKVEKPKMILEVIC